MNISQYVINEKMAHDAIVSITHLASVKTSIANAGESRNGDTRCSDDREILHATIDGARCDYSVEPDGSACIVKCLDDPTTLELPRTVEGHPVARIGSHAFCTCYGLERVKLPDTLSEIGEYAFMNTRLASIEAPANLRHIRKNAFYKCAVLEKAALNESLLSIGECAFRESALEELAIPASVESIGINAFKDTRLVFDGPGQTLTLSDNNSCYLLEGGVLYARDGSMAALVQALDPDLSAYRGRFPIVAVASRAFSGLEHLEQVELPDGVRAIGNEAFKGCVELDRIGLPDSIEHIGGHAFMNTRIESLRIPASLTSIGMAAFYTGGTIARNFKRTIEHVEIAPGNTTFYLENGILCQRRPDEGDLVVLGTGTEESVCIPLAATTVGPYAFLNASHVRTLRIHDGLENIDVGGLDFGNAAPTVVYDVVHDDEHAGERYVISYPPGHAGRQAARQAFSRGHFDLKYAYAGADNAVLTTRDVFIRAKSMLERLRNPVMLDPRMRESFEKALRNNVPDVVVAFGRNGFVQGIDWLHEAGLLHAGNIDEAVEAASSAGEIAALSRLIELRRTAFAAPLFDFDL